MGRKYLFSLALCIIFLPAAGLAWTGLVTDPPAVMNGDTFSVLKEDGQVVEVRLFGIDAPEFDESKNDGENQPYGREAKDFTAAFVKTGNLSMEELYVDENGPPVVIVTTEGQVLNEELLKAGLAWYSHKYCDREFCEQWKHMEEGAMGARAGVWHDLNTDHTPIAPWVWKKERSTSGSKVGKAALGVGKVIGMFFGISF